MTTAVDIDFEKLEENIIELKTLFSKMDEPSYDKVEFWLGDVGGSGMVREHLIVFCSNTIRFYNDVYKLIENTITYLETVKKLKTVDQSIADSL